MIESDPQLGTFNVTARLFKLIFDMPKCYGTSFQINLRYA
jgi:hypothetical protein